MFLISALVGIGFGWAKPVPVNYYYLRNPRRDIILVSLAGAGANILLAFACLAFHHLFRPLSLLSSWFSIGYILNLFLAFFNLLPIPPLDGSKVLMALLPPRYSYAYARLETYGFIILFVFILSGLFGVLVDWFVRLISILL